MIRRKFISWTGRWFFTLACAASLLLCIALAAAWVRTLLAVDLFRWLSDSEMVEIQSGVGAVQIFVMNSPACSQLRDQLGRYSHETFGPGKVAPGETAGTFRDWKFVGFEWKSARVPDARMRALIIPLWFPVAVFLPLSAVAVGTLLRRWRRWRESRRGLCRVCGYDLRASPDRCPECGTVREKGRS